MEFSWGSCVRVTLLILLIVAIVTACYTLPIEQVLDLPEVSVGEFRFVECSVDFVLSIFVVVFVLNFVKFRRCRKPRISYSRVFLLSMSDVDACTEFPDGFDQSILGELANNSTQQQLHSYNSYSSGETSGSSRESALAEKLSQKDSNFSSKESAERWDSCKLSPKDGNLADYERWTCNQSRQLLQNSGNTGNLRSPMREHIGILGSRSGSKILRDGSDESTPHVEEARPPATCNIYKVRTLIFK